MQKLSITFQLKKFKYGLIDFPERVRDPISGMAA
jgi:hypothetical protein